MRNLNRGMDNSNNNINSEMEMSPSEERQSQGDEICEHDNLQLSEQSPQNHYGDLSVIQAAALLTADVVGTGILALPENVAVLGKPIGLTFLIANLPLNWYAGYLLSRTTDGVDGDRAASMTSASSSTAVRGESARNKSANGGQYHNVITNEMPNNEQSITTEPDGIRVDSDAVETSNDFIELTEVICGTDSRAKTVVMIVFYVNVFLLLGDYILVMARAVSAIFEDDICFPHAGIVACILMFGLTQIRRLRDMGGWITVVSLGSLCVVVFQCLVATSKVSSATTVPSPDPTQVPLLRKLSALASICFATGINKLLLNIRHEMRERRRVPQTLGLSMGVFGSAYVGVAVFAGSNPPGFLFDAIPRGSLSRRFSGLLLWIHVAISYAINSQAICSSLDQNLKCIQGLRPQWRWLALTATLAVSSYIVANAVPFFKDLVALIGALTSVPLAILIPVLLHRHYHNYSIWLPTRDSLTSYGLVVFGVFFLVTGLVGALGAIELDWQGHGMPFSCTPSSRR